MKNILIPTDFSVDSLTLLKKALEEEKAEKISICLVHAIHLPTSITDLLFFSKSKLLQQLQGENFLEAKSVLQNRYSNKITSLQTDLLIGNSKNAVNNYLVANKIDHAYLPADSAVFTYRHKLSVNFLPELKANLVEVSEIAYEKTVQDAKFGILSRILT